MQDLISKINPIDLTILVMAITGATELAKLLIKKDYQKALVIVVAAVTGALVGLSRGLDLYYGMVLGLVASGINTTIKAGFGNNSANVTGTSANKVNKINVEQEVNNG